jgi:hypothetical protein
MMLRQRASDDTANGAGHQSTRHGRCPDCGYIVNVRVDGTIARHRLPHDPESRDWGGYRHCPGEDQQPAIDPRFDAAFDEVYRR